MASITITIPDAIVPKVIEAMSSQMGDSVKGLTDGAVARLFVSESVKAVYERHWTARNGKSAYATLNAATDAARAAQEAAATKLRADIATVAATVKAEAEGVL